MNRKSVSVVLGTALLALSAFPAALAQGSDKEMREGIEALKKGQQQIRSDLAEIKKLLQSGQRAAPAGSNVKGKIFDLGDNPVRGARTAKLTLVEFTDYQ